MSETPEYVALGAVFLGGRLIEPGELFISDETPGRKWQPANETAEAKVAARTAERKAIEEKAARLMNEPTNPAAVEIPSHWMDLRPEQVVNLARRLGCSSRCNFTQAIAWIEKTLAERKSAAEPE